MINNVMIMFSQVTKLTDLTKIENQNVVNSLNINVINLVLTIMLGICS